MKVRNGGGVDCRHHRTLTRSHALTSFLVPRSGRSTKILRGNLLSTASSKSKGLFVEPMTTTLDAPPTPSPFVPLLSPSHSLIIVVLTLVSVPCAESSECSRLLRRLSTSSMNTTHGARRLARVNTALAFFSLSPSHLFSTLQRAKRVAKKEVFVTLEQC